MPSAIQNPQPQRLLSTIYRQSWPPPRKILSNRQPNSQVQENKLVAGNLWQGGSPFETKESSRPFSANLLTQGERSKLMNQKRMGKRPDASEKPSTERKKVPEYDGRKVDFGKNHPAVEYLAMLSGKNYLRKQFREQYRISESERASQYTRPSTAHAYAGPRSYKLYPDLGSVIGRTTTPLIAANGLSPPGASSESPSQWRSRQPPSVGKNADFKENGSDPTGMINAVSNSNSFKGTSDGLVYAMKRSWSNIPTGKCYRVLSQPNDTLASLCLEGRPAQFKGLRSRTSSASSSTSFCSFASTYRHRTSSVGNSSPSGSSQTISGSCEEDDTSSSKRQPPSKIVTDPDEIRQEHEETIHGLPMDSVFQDDENIRCCESDYGEEEDASEQEECVRALPTSSKFRYSYSDLEGSDISENEADDDDEKDVDEQEFSRRLQQVSAVFDTSRNSDVIDDAIAPTVTRSSLTNLENEAGTKSIVNSDGVINDLDNASKECDDVIDNSRSEEDLFEFANFFPPSFDQSILGELASLPAGVDWRSCVKLPSFPCRKTTESRREQARKTQMKKMKRAKSFEDIVDRLITLQKMQELSVQYEKERKRHLLHQQQSQSRPKSRYSSSKSNSATAANNIQADDSRPQSAKGSRRPSTPSAAITSPTQSTQKRTTSNGDLKIEGTGENKSPDIDLVRLSCTKNHLQYVRHSSFSAKRKQRPRSALPRYYEYSWSERMPEGKRLGLGSLVYTKPRSCRTCQERARKLSQINISQMMLGRSRSSFLTFSCDQQRQLSVRPATTDASLHPRVPTTHIPKDSTDNEGNKPKTHEDITRRRASTPRRSNAISTTTFGHAPASGVNANATNRATPDNISAARAIVTSMARDYARVAGFSSQKHSRSASAPSPVALRPKSATTSLIIVKKRNHRVLRPHVVDCTKIRLR